MRASSGIFTVVDHYRVVPVSLVGDEAQEVRRRMRKEVRDESHLYPKAIIEVIKI